MFAKSTVICVALQVMLSVLEKACRHQCTENPLCLHYTFSAQPQHEKGRCALHTQCQSPVFKELSLTGQSAGDQAKRPSKRQWLFLTAPACC